MGAEGPPHGEDAPSDARATCTDDVACADVGTCINVFMYVDLLQEGWDLAHVALSHVLHQARAHMSPAVAILWTITVINEVLT